MTDSNSSNPAPPTLDYGRRSRMSWIGRHKKKLIFLALCIAAAIPIYQHRDPLKRRTLWLYWSHRAAAHAMPASIPLVVTDPAEVKKLLATNPDYVAGNASATLALYVPQVFRKWHDTDDRTDLLFTYVADWSYDPPRDKQPVAFLGTVRRPDGVARIMLVRGALGQLATNDFPGFGADPVRRIIVMPIPSMSDPMPVATLAKLRFTSTGSSWQLPRCELRGGIIDPANPSHVSFQMIVSSGPESWEYKPVPASSVGNTGTIDAFLQNDDSVLIKLQLKQGTKTYPPTTRPASVEYWQERAKRPYNSGLFLR